MSIHKIVKYPARVLRKVAASVEEVTPEIRALLDEMADIMYAANGIGLAAPQVGESLRLITVDTGVQNVDGTVGSNLVQLINPVITLKEGETAVEEGCLSCPDFTLSVDRAKKIHVVALDKNGVPVELDAEDIFAVAIQHEIDHLDGITLLDRVSQLKREIWLREQKMKKEETQEPFSM